MRASYRRLWPDPGGAGSGQYRPEGAVMTCSVTSSVPKFPETRCLCFYTLGGERSDADRPQGRVLLPTPSVADVMGGRKHRSGERDGELLLNGIAHHDRWGDYAAAIASHERLTGRPAPDPTEPGAKGNPRLSARFVEWMMCLPAGWVTDVPGITRNQAIKALGNGVVPPQAAAALRLMLDRMTLT